MNEKTIQEQCYGTCHEACNQIEELTAQLSIAMVERETLLEELNKLKEDKRLRRIQEIEDQASEWRGDAGSEYRGGFNGHGL